MHSLVVVNLQVDLLYRLLLLLHKGVRFSANILFNLINLLISEVFLGFNLIKWHLNINLLLLLMALILVWFIVFDLLDLN